ncbi:MAG TPA: response regulator transcription factor [Pyrinomonadaceae bacterium]|nr:response regulator transcription factor [Pyrinomonadaceae bacterium]
MNILIVEDNEQMRRTVKSLVKDLVALVFECDDGASALSAYTQHRPDWVLMDIDLPEIDGISATRQIVAAYPEARVMIVTNYDDAYLREAARLAGACEYVFKKDLIEIRRILAAYKFS